MFTNFDVIEKNDGKVIIDVHEGVLDLGYIDYCCKEAVEINIPSTVVSIDPWAFCEMSKIERFNVNQANKHFVEVDGCVYSNDKSTLIAYPPSKACEYFEIPASVENIAPGAFRGACQLQCIKIGENVKAIGYEAFAGASAVERIYISKSVEVIECFLEEYEDLDLYIMCREDLVIGGEKGSAIEHWCQEHAVRFCSLRSNQVEDFLMSPSWNHKVPKLDYNNCWECMKKTL